MINTRIYFDKRRIDREGRGQLRLFITKNGSSAMLSLGIALKEVQWANGKVINHPKATLYNRIIQIKMGAIQGAIMEAQATGAFAGATAKDVADKLKEILDPDLAIKRQKELEEKAIAENSFMRYFEEIIQTKRTVGTKQLYRDTFNKIKAYCQEDGNNYEILSFNDITPKWLERFQTFCRRTEKQNTTARHLRDIRAIFNDAIDEGKTERYPFRKFKIRHEVTVDKSYSAEELRNFFHATPYMGGEEEALDIFKLMFLLIGINSVDLANASKPVKGRLNYVRQKTHKSYSIKIEPEAMSIIKKYDGKEHLLNLIERTPNYKTYFNRMSKTLRKIGLVRISGKRSSGKAILPKICIGSARTSWATIAQEELDIPRDVIAAALGHHTVDVTSTYLRTDWRKKIDAANRKVIDWVFYQKN